MGSSILEVKNVSSYYGTRERKQVLRNVTFSLEEGEVLGLVGESGCGKTTLCKAILGFLKDYEGEIIHGSEHPQMVFQDPYSSLNPARKIGWIMEEPLKNRGGLSSQERKRKVEEMLCLVGLDGDFAGRYPSQLSGGQRQRICIGAALMLEPRLLIADEPVSALDVTIQAQILELLKNLQKKKNLSVFFISHDLRVVYNMCNRVLIMKGGTIVESGSTQEIYFRPQSSYTKQLLDAAGIFREGELNGRKRKETGGKNEKGEYQDKIIDSLSSD